MLKTRMWTLLIGGASIMDCMEQPGSAVSRHDLAMYESGRGPYFNAPCFSGMCFCILKVGFPMVTTSSWAMPRSQFEPPAET